MDGGWIWWGKGSTIVVLWKDARRHCSRGEFRHGRDSEGCLGEASGRAPRQAQSAGKHCWVLKKLRGQLASHNSQRCPSRH